MVKNIIIYYFAYRIPYPQKEEKINLYCNYLKKSLNRNCKAYHEDGVKIYFTGRPFLNPMVNSEG